jgi:hypothetical protein
VFASYSLAARSARRRRRAGRPGSAARRDPAMFVLYAVLALAAALVYRGLPSTLVASRQRAPSPLGPSKRNVYTLAALFSLDAFGGGFVVQSMLALWLYQRFDCRSRPPARCSSGPAC